MPRSFQEADDDPDRSRVRTWAGRAYTDDELSRRFGAETEDAPTGGLMDEAAVKRMLAAEREQAATGRAPPPEPPARAPAASRAPATGASRSRSRSRSMPRGPPTPPQAAPEAAPAAPRVPAAPAAPSASSAPVSFTPGDTLRPPEAPLRAAPETPAPQPAAAEAPPAAHAEAQSGGGGGSALRAGCLARLTGLKAAAHLNGETGRLLRFDEEAGRWEVRLSDGDAKAIKAENLLALPASEQEAAKPMVAEDLWVAPQSPDDRRADVAPRTPPQAAPAAAPPGPTVSGRMPQAPPASAGVAGLSSAALAGTGHVASSRPPPAAQPKTSRRLGTVRWYNGRRKLGYIIPDGGGNDLFIPAQGAPNGSQVPPQPGGLFHGTRVSFMPMALARGDAWSAGQSGNAKSTDVVCMDVRALSGQVGLSCGVESSAGAKEVNDDRIAATDLNELGFMAGVFDGHRGHTCAEYVAKQLPSAVVSAYQTRAKREGSLVKLSAANEAGLISGALVDAFEATDRAFLVAARKKEWLDGSTGIICLVSHGFEAPANPAPAALGCAALWPKPKEPAVPEKQPGTVPRALGGVAKLFVAWCGDCRCVLLRGRQGLRVSEDHRPSRPDEQKRVQRAGGTVVQDGRGVWRVGPRADNKLVKELQKRRRDVSQMKWFLSTSRGFGDSELKAPDPVVTATPEVKVVDLVPEDWAVILGSDGIFDVLSDQEVADTLWRSMVAQSRDPVRAAKDVVQAALRRGSRDNLTAVVMRLGWAPPPGLDGAAPGVAPAPASDAPESLNIFG